MITVHLTTSQTATPADLAAALAQSKPDDVARFFRAFFDITDRDEDLLNEIASACAGYGLPNMVEKFNRVVTAHDWNKRHPAK